MAQDRKFILDPIDVAGILDVWKKLKDPDTVYYACVVNSKGSHKLYMESLSGYYGHCRVFLDKGELDRYMMEIIVTNGYSPSSMKRYEFNLNSLIATFSSLSKKNTDNGFLKVTINSFDLVDLREVDVLWDGKSN
jgi:hypothetical protein